MMKRLRKILLWIVLLIVVLLLLTIIFISPIAKYLIEKNSVKYTGRQIRMEKLHINIFTGKITIDSLLVYEPGGKAIFFSCQKLRTDIALYKLWKSKYDITSITAEQPFLHIIQDGSRFNYDDLFERFISESDTTTSTGKSESVKYWIRNSLLQDGELVYENKDPYNNVRIIHLNGKVPLIAWNDPEYNIQFDFAFSEGGEVKNSLQYNIETSAYKLVTDIEKLNISWLYPYLKEYMKVKSLDGQFSSHLSLEGNIDKPEAIAASGNISLNTFGIVDYTGETMIKIGELLLDIDSLNTSADKYAFKSFLVTNPFIRLSVYDDGYNYERVLNTAGSVSVKMDSSVVTGGQGSSANMFRLFSEYIAEIVKEYTISNYNLDLFRLEGGQVVFTDHTHGERFNYTITDLAISSERINSNSKLMTINTKCRVNKDGQLTGVLKMDPENYSDISLTADIKGLWMKDFNPYYKYYVATPFLTGKVNYHNSTTIKNRWLKSENDLQILKVTAGKKVKNSTATNVPVRLAISLLKDKNGDIKIDFPVAGNIDDPKFRWGPLVWQVLKNLMVKAVNAPYKLFSNVFGGKEEDYREIQFEYGQTILEEKQQYVLDNLSQVLMNDTAFTLQLIMDINKENEIEVLALKKAKAAHLGWQDLDNLAAEQWQQIKSLPDDDTAFQKYLITALKDSAGLTSTPERCIRLFGKTKLSELVDAGVEKRNKAILLYITKEKGIAPSRISITSVPPEEGNIRSHSPIYAINIGLNE